MSSGTSSAKVSRATSKSSKETPITTYSSDDESDAQDKSSAAINGSSDEEEEGDKIQQIIGIKNVSGVTDDDDSIELTSVPQKDLHFFVKWANKSHIHDSFMTEVEVVDTPGGEAALKKFKSRSQDGLSPSHSNSEILTVYQEDLNESWTKVDRLLGEADDGD